MERYSLFESDSKAVEWLEEFVKSIDKKWADPSYSSAKLLGDLLYHDCSILPQSAPAPQLVQWSRIWSDEILDCSSPFTFPDRGRRYSPLVQGRLANSYALNALSLLTATTAGQEALKSIIVSDAHASSLGIYLVKFWKDGRWVYVTIDDRIPCDSSGSPLYTHAQDLNETWVLVVEKAYAKLYGSYLNLENGRIVDALRDFTGGVPEYLKMDWYDLESRVKANTLTETVAKSVIGVRARKTAMRRSDGIVSGWLYGITGMYEPASGVRLVKLVDMFNLSCWKGRWSSRDEAWNENIDIKEQLNPDDEWPETDLFIAWDDFSTIFNELVNCTLCGDPDIWKHSTFNGCFAPNSVYSGGGGSPNDEMSFLSNPMVTVSAAETIDVAIVLRQGQDPRLLDFLCLEADRGFLVDGKKKSRLDVGDDVEGEDEENEEKKVSNEEHSAGLLEKAGLGVMICKLGPYRSGKRRIHRLTRDRVLAHSGLMYRNNTNQVSCSVTRLQKGDYVIIPSTYEKNVFGKFTLEVYTTETKAESVCDFFPPAELEDMTNSLNETPDEDESEDEDGKGKGKPFPPVSADTDPDGIDDFVSRDYLEMQALQNMMAKVFEL